MPILLLVSTVLLAAIIVLALLLRTHLRTPIRRYEGPQSVSNIYDQWTNDRILEYYWGEHLHAGHYGNPPVKKNFVEAKVDFIDEMIRWGVVVPNPELIARLERPGPGSEPVRILDVGCGIGGSVRHLAKRWPKTAQVTGITISKAQVERARELTRAAGIENATIMACDALNMSFPDGSFDIIYSVESEMHMPDKATFVREQVRVLKPGGLLIVAGWNVRDTRNAPLSKDEAAHIRLLVEEWSHATFSSTREYIEMLEQNSLLGVTSENWAVPTQPTWRDAVWVSARNPSGMMNVTMKQRWGLVRDAYTILRYDEAFRTGLCDYGLIRGQKKG